MAEAVVGDEQNREDPTVGRLQQLVAELTGKEASLYLPSGTMCNAIGVKLHTCPGDKVIVDRAAHVFTSECGGLGLMAGVLTAPIDGPGGIFTAEQLEEAISPHGGYNHAPPTLVCLENTHNRGGGRIWPWEVFLAVTATARRFGLRVHLDGARLLNAVVASGIPATRWAAEVDTLWIDLSKGLGAPVGAVIAGDRAAIEKAWHYKLVFGGAMRQAGIIAAGGVYGLLHHLDRLSEDHVHAQRLAQGLNQIPKIQCDPTLVETNIVFFDVAETGWNAVAFNNQLQAEGVRMAAGSYGPTRVRAVTHRDITGAAIEQVIALIEKLIRKGC